MTFFYIIPLSHDIIPFNFCNSLVVFFVTFQNSHHSNVYELPPYKLPRFIFFDPIISEFIYIGICSRVLNCRCNIAEIAFKHNTAGFPFSLLVLPLRLLYSLRDEFQTRRVVMQSYQLPHRSLCIELR